MSSHPAPVDPQNRDFGVNGDDACLKTKPTVCETPDGDAVDQLCHRLAALAPHYRSVEDWPAESLAACADAGVFRWFLPESSGGLGWNEADQVRGYLRLAAADLTTTFVVTQFIGACKRIASSNNAVPKQRYLKDLLSGNRFATVGISHLTTSSRHLGTPALRATTLGNGYRVDGM
jgi:alkylation response protein AidB-like acyl-CoA dehydrogenase